MPGGPDRSPIPFDVRAEFWAEKVYAATANMVAAFESAAREDGLIQEIIAERLQKDSAQISRWLRGQKNLTVRTLSEMALAMDCDLQIEFILLKDVAVPNYQYELPRSTDVKTFSIGNKPTIEFSSGNESNIQLKVV